MHFYSYLLCFAASGGLSLALTKVVRDFAITRGLVVPPVLDRHVHKHALPKLGGVAIFLSVVAVCVVAFAGLKGISGMKMGAIIRLVGLLAGSTIILLLGVYDDLRGVGAKLKFGVQACAAILLFLSGYGIQHFDLISSSPALRAAVGLPLTILWVLLITNAFNLIDGLDGLAAGSAFFSTVVMFVISLLRGDVTVSLITVALAGAILGFLRFNFSPATIFLGDSGSLFIGFLLSAAALAGSQKATTIVAVAIPVVAFGLPILDVALAVVRRFLRAKPLFDGDNDHIHHKLLKRGLSHRRAVLVLYGVTACFGFLSMALLHGESILALVLVLIAIGVVFGVQQLRYQEFAELVSALRRLGRRRLANNVSVRHAKESLKDCDDFSSICDVLKKTLQPIGFDGIRLQMLHPNGFAPSSFQPLAFVSDGSLLYNWSSGETGETPWELRLELLTSAYDKWGYVTLIRMSDANTLLLDVNALTPEFRTSLSNAINRACARMEAALKAQESVRGTKSYKRAAGSMAD